MKTLNGIFSIYSFFVHLCAAVTFCIFEVGKSFWYLGTPTRRDLFISGVFLDTRRSWGTPSSCLRYRVQLGLQSCIVLGFWVKFNFYTATVPYFPATKGQGPPYLFEIGPKLKVIYHRSFTFWVPHLAADIARSTESAFLRFRKC